MLLLELLCLAIVAIHLAVAATRAEAPGAFMRRVALIATASWVAEDTCIRLYGFYAYNPRWAPFLDRMPVMVALIWPGVILSSLELSQRLLGEDRRRWVPLAGAAMVLADASFMEPVAVKAGLWTWFEPGFFGVPPIGVLGWAFFSLAVLAVLERSRLRHGAGGRLAAEVPLLLLAPAFTHLALLGSWWGLLRWVSVPLSSWAAAALFWAVGLSLAALALRRRARRLIPPGAMVTRIPAALFFFGLLCLYARDDPALVAHALAFAPPYLALTRLTR